MDNRYTNLFIKQFNSLKKRPSWNKIYIGIDIHETVLKPTWDTVISTEFYEHALETLQIMSKRSDMCLIMWTSSLPKLCDEYIDFFKKHDIHFDYVNNNPECENTNYANFKTKLYFNVGLDDKFGFDPNKDWKPILNFVNTYPIYNNE